MEFLILTPELLRNFPGISIEKIELLHQPISITPEELSSMDKEMYELIGQREETQLRIWRIEGMISSFTKDLIAM